MTIPVGQECPLPLLDIARVVGAVRLARAGALCALDAARPFRITRTTASEAGRAALVLEHRALAQLDHVAAERNSLCLTLVESGIAASIDEVSELFGLSPQVRRRIMDYLDSRARIAAVSATHGRR
jgi:hypothetical protein